MSSAQAVGKPPGGLVAPVIVEGQHRDRRLGARHVGRPELPSTEDDRERGERGHRRHRPARRRSEEWPARPFAVEPQAIHPHRPADVLDLVLASEIEGPIELALQMVIGRARHHQAAWLGQLLQPRRDIDAIAIDIAIHQRHIAQIEPNPKHNALGLRQSGVVRGHGLLDLGCANHRIDHAVEDDECTVAHQLDNAAMVAGDGGIGQFGPDGTQPRDSAGLVGLHRLGVTDDIGRQDR
jgi:hypothetical protein